MLRAAGLCGLNLAGDFYKDLPSDVVGPNASTWENYKSANVYNDNFISQLKDKGVDYWLINREMYKEINGQRYYMISHNYNDIPSSKILTPNWSKNTLPYHYYNGIFFKVYIFEVIFMFE